MTPHTTAHVARELGITAGLVRRLARQHNLGTLVTPRLRLFSDADVAAMRQRNKRRGRPVVPSA